MAYWHVYVGGLTSEVWEHFPDLDPGSTVPSAGIERYLFNDADGSLSHLDTTGSLRSPQDLTTHPYLPVLYATEFAEPGRIVSFLIDADGRLTRQSFLDSLGSLAIAASVNPAGSMAYVSHLGDGTITACSLGESGALLGAQRISADGAEQRGSKVHQVRVTRSGNGLVATDFGCDEVITFALDEEGTPSESPIATVVLPTGTRPRHIAFHPTGRIVYVVGEGDSRLYVLDAKDDVPLGVISSQRVTPADYHGESSISELELHPDGHTLFVGVRRANLITVFSVDDDGAVEAIHHESSRGRNPRAIKVAPTGRHLLVGNWHSNQVAVFAIADGRHLSPMGSPVEVPSPSSIVFRRASS